MNEGFAYIDGAYCPIDEARISVLDPGFTHSDAVYDVVSTWAGMFFRLDDHVRRFLASCTGFQIACPRDGDFLKRVLANCAVKGGLGDRAYCALVLTRGPYSKEGLRTRDIFTTTPNLIAYALPYAWVAEPARQEKGFHLIIAKTLRIPSACIDSRYKNYHWGDLTQGKFEAKAAGADAAVHLSIDGFLTEGAGYNLFFIRGGRVYTPEHNVLLGITRQSVIDIAQERGIPVEIGNFGAEALRAAEECFITSTAGGIMPVVRVDGQSLGSGSPGPLTLQIRAEYWQRREQGWLGTPVSSLLEKRRLVSGER